jgi:hypothetical protein
MLNKTDIRTMPACPRRLYSDQDILKCNRTPPAMESRRANKMRERFPVQKRQTTASIDLVAPVQPSIKEEPLAGNLLIH